jgi:hypothetical protein
VLANGVLTVGAVRADRRSPVMKLSFHWIR